MIPMCSTVEYANMRLYSRTWSSRKAAIATDNNPITIIHRPILASGDNNTIERSRRIAYRGIEVLTPESTAHTGDGAWLWASGSHVCIGARPTFVPNPTKTSRNASLNKLGGME